MSSISNFFADVRFDELLRALWDGGWYSIIFPFLLIYAIVFTILNNVDIKALDSKPTKVIIALVFGLFAVAFPITGDGGFCVGSYCGNTLGDLMMALFPGVSAFAVGILALYIVAAMLGMDLMKFFGNNENNNNIIKYALGGLGVFVVVYYYARGFGWEGFGSGTWIANFFTDPLLYIILLFGLFFWWVTSDEGINKEEKRRQREEEKARRALERGG